MMARFTLAALLVLGGVHGAEADSWAACAQDNDVARTIRGCTEFLNRQKGPAEKILLKQSS
jgi:hypothetical protein